MFRIDILLISVGLAFLVVGVAGSLLRWLDVDVPILRKAAPNILLLEVGIVITAVGFYLHYHSPPGAPAGITVTADPVAPYSGPCPARVVVTGSIEMSTGGKDVNYHAVVIPSYGAQINGRPLNAHFARSGTQQVSDTLHLVVGTEPSTFTFYFQTDTPVRQASNRQHFTVECTK
jgi:hypothetical protein